ncbi:hypothetical protein [Aquimarina sp. 2201CG5-10]|uniref:hypothetical protein n=1 Tax=Aquimarina callyspongiae TaxID=3098150 RepID=UPI002AB4CDFE|nr:hypothetical protein [Aquimarina sp. 2201CG5-10]MDY8136053.1 hypothetical protein [Aquimarina sp. 2201CG5-10]
MKELKIELINSFKPVLSNTSFILFETLINSAEEINYLSHGYELTFPNPSEDYEGFTFTISSPLKNHKDNKSPKHFQNFLTICDGFEWGTAGDEDQLILHNGYEGTLHAIGQDLVGNKIEYNENIFAPIDIGLQAFYFIHPETNKLCLYDELIEEVKDTDDPIEIYLRELHYELKGFSCDESFNDVFKDATHRSEWLNSID